MRSRFPAAALLVLALLPSAAAADDFGPHRDLAQVRSDARRLLAHRVRETGVDPSKVAISDVVVVQNQALLSWDSGKQHGLMGLVRYLDRWWDAYDSTAISGAACRQETIAFPLSGRLSKDLRDAATVHNAAFEREAAMPVCPRSRADAGLLNPPRSQMQGYGFALQVSRNDAAPGVTFTRVYGRAPTAGEILANPPPPKDFGGSTDVFLFDLDINASKAVQFAAGSKLDIWFPFVLDDQLRYDLSYFTMGHVSPNIPGTLFDNVLHFDLPAFAMAPNDTLMADVEGWW